MVIVFASFIIATEAELKQLGFALAVVVLIDAALTRRLLIPAALRLLGHRAWSRRPSRQAPPPAIRHLAPGHMRRTAMKARSKKPPVPGQPQDARQECCDGREAGEEQSCCGRHGGRGERCCGRPRPRARKA